LTDVNIKHNLSYFSGRTGNIILVGAIATSLAIYFSLSIHILPRIYLSMSRSKPLPILNNVHISPLQVPVGNPFDISLIGSNQGNSADLQIISVAFPNLTSTDGFAQVKESDFNQRPIIVKKGDELGSGYLDNEIPIRSKYPLIEAYNRPWHSHDTHHIVIQVRPYTIGRFVIFVKTFTLPYSNQLSHYPREGTKDQQGEFVNVYSINVTDAYLRQSIYLKEKRPFEVIIL
jgi:hypothetical protein